MSHMEPQYSLTRPFSFPWHRFSIPITTFGTSPLHSSLSFSLLSSSLDHQHLLHEACTWWWCLCWYQGSMDQITSVKLTHRMGNAVEKHLANPFSPPTLSLINFNSVLPRVRGQAALSGSSEWSRRTQSPRLVWWCHSEHVIAHMGAYC